MSQGPLLMSCWATAFLTLGREYKSGKNLYLCWPFKHYAIKICEENEKGTDKDILWFHRTRYSLREEYARINDCRRPADKHGSFCKQENFANHFCLRGISGY